MHEWRDSGPHMTGSRGQAREIPLSRHRGTRWSSGSQSRNDGGAVEERAVEPLFATDSIETRSVEFCDNDRVVSLAVLRMASPNPRAREHQRTLSRLRLGVPEAAEGVG